MKRYKCHKVVEAAKIVSVVGNIVNLVDEPSVTVSADYGLHFRPEEPDDLGYLVRYKDGYLSWSPTKAIEDGYTLETELGVAALDPKQLEKLSHEELEQLVKTVKEAAGQ